MKKLPTLIIAATTLCLSFMPGKKEEVFFTENFSFAKTQLNRMLAEANTQDTLFPRSIDRQGKLVLTDKYEWTSGFFPGSLWYAYEATKDEAIQQQAIQWTEKLESLQSYTQHHDLGFMMYCSYGNAYRLTGNARYKDILVHAAQSLATRFSPKTGCIKSWNAFGSWDAKSRYNFPVIIDNMMNLELLFFASKATNDPRYKQMAISHIENVMNNQVREDYSCYHVVCYDSATGKVLSRETAQGFSDNSAWARGQSWGIYGFTMAYRETGDKRFLKTARKMADFYLDNKELPQDKIPYWDFYANNPGYVPSVKSHALETPAKFRDASAAAVTASALIELSSFLGKEGDKYKQGGVDILHALSSPVYRAKEGSNGNFILKHSVGSIPHGSEIDVPLVYADYYYLEALCRYKDLVNKDAAE
jgi:unsaturated chondroitin disaccharide hydrolase